MGRVDQPQSIAMRRVCPAIIAGLLAACSGMDTELTEDGGRERSSDSASPAVHNDATTREARDAGAPMPSPDTGPTDALGPGPGSPDGHNEGQPSPAAHDGGRSDDGAVSTIALSGRVTYDRVSPGLGHGGLDYSRILAMPARRVRVQALDAETGRPIGEATTNDDGRYVLSLARAASVRLRALAESASTGNLRDGLGPETCLGASWQTRVVDNTRRNALYVLDDPRTFNGGANDVNLHASLIRRGRYVSRAAAPFALLDMFVSELELVCSGHPSPALARLEMAWSPANEPSGDDPAHGEIGLSYFSSDGGENRLFVLGKEDVDTDEYDAHIVAHELGHFFEEQLYRSDAYGGDHVDQDVLDPREAFGEGFGNAIAAMVLEDPRYIDTFGTNQSEIYAFDIDATPTGDDRGIYSETSAQYLLWSLFENRDAVPRHGSYARIHDALLRHRTTQALTTLQSFSAYYNELFGGGAEQLFDLWEGALASPRDSLCAGACSGLADRADPFDVDGDLGLEYGGRRSSAMARSYPAGSGRTFPSEFWQLYRVLELGRNAPTPHDRTAFGGYDAPENKLGAIRWYRYVATGARARVAVDRLQGARCRDGALGLQVFFAGRELGNDDGAHGCPTVRFSTVPGQSYVILVLGTSRELSGWEMEVSE